MLCVFKQGGTIVPLSANISARVSEDVRAGALSLLVALPALQATLAGSTKSGFSGSNNGIGGSSDTPAAGSWGGSLEQGNHVMCAAGSSGCKRTAAGVGASSALAPAEAGQAVETARRLLRSSNAAGDPEVAQTSWVRVATGRLALDTSDDLQVGLLRQGCQSDLNCLHAAHSPGMHAAHSPGMHAAHSPGMHAAHSPGMQQPAARQGCVPNRV